MDTPPDGPAQHERSSEREQQKLLVAYTIDLEHAREYTETYDIAVGGIAMHTNAALAPNTRIIVDLELTGDPHPPLRLNANVRWSTFDPMIEKYRTGVAFTDRPVDFERDLARYIDALHQLRDIGAR